MERRKGGKEGRMEKKKEEGRERRKVGRDRWRETGKFKQTLA